MIYFPHTDLTVDTDGASNYALIYERIQWHADSPFYVALPSYLYGNSDTLRTLAEPYGCYKDFADFIASEQTYIAERQAADSAYPDLVVSAHAGVTLYYHPRSNWHAIVCGTQVYTVYGYRAEGFAKALRAVFGTLTLSDFDYIPVQE